MNWLSLKHRKIKNVGGSSNVLSQRVFGEDGKLWPRLVLSIRNWDRDDVLFSCSIKENAGEWWVDRPIPVSLLSEMREMVEEVEAKVCYENQKDNCKLDVDIEGDPEDIVILLTPDGKGYGAKIEALKRIAKRNRYDYDLLNNLYYCDGISYTIEEGVENGEKYSITRTIPVKLEVTDDDRAAMSVKNLNFCFVYNSKLEDKGPNDRYNRKTVDKLKRWQKWPIIKQIREFCEQ